MTAGVDPQLDNNVLIRLLNGETAFVNYARLNQAAGLSYGRVARDEFLAIGLGTSAHLETLFTSYGAIYRSFQGYRVKPAAARLQKAFSGDAFGRVLRPADARIFATAFLTAEWVATSDLQLYKRARDLGLLVNFVGVGRSATRAGSYMPRLVVIPGVP